VAQGVAGREADQTLAREPEVSARSCNRTPCGITVVRWSIACRASVWSMRRYRGPTPKVDGTARGRVPGLGQRRAINPVAAHPANMIRSMAGYAQPGAGRAGEGHLAGCLREPGWCSRRLPAALLWTRTSKLLGQQFLPAYSLSFVSTAVHIFLGFDKTRVSPNGS
jgi:hypothetical protein